MTLYIICSVTGSNTPMSNCKDGDVRLEDGQTKYEGRVEICINKAWGTVCTHQPQFNYFYFTTSRYWNSVQANVVCRQLGHMELGKNACRITGSLVMLNLQPYLLVK